MRFFDYQVLLLILEEILPIWWDQGFFNAICANPSWTPVSKSSFTIQIACADSISFGRDSNSTI